MHYKKIFNTNLNVSKICLGTMTWGQQKEKERSKNDAVDTPADIFRRR